MDYTDNTYIPEENDFQEKSKTLAIVSLVFGIIGGVAVLTCCCCLIGFPVPLITGLVALICGIIALAKHHGGKGMAIAGVVLGAVSLACGLIAAVEIAAVGNLSTEDFVAAYAEEANISLEEALNQLKESGLLTENEDGTYSFAFDFFSGTVTIPEGTDSGTPSESPSSADPVISMPDETV